MDLLFRVTCEDHVMIFWVQFLIISDHPAKSGDYKNWCSEDIMSLMVEEQDSTWLQSAITVYL